MDDSKKANYLNATAKLIIQLPEQNRRLHITKRRVKFRQPSVQVTDLKPVGMWYGFDDSWMSWCIENVSGWLKPYIYEIIPHEDKILRITDEDEFEAFEDEYWGVKGKTQEELWFMMPNSYGMRFVNYIDWRRVSEKYCGIEIVPYLYTKRLESLWYYGFDVACGVIWDKAGIQEIKLFAEYNGEMDCFTLH